MSKRLYCSDVEADALLDSITKLWCACFTELDHKGNELRQLSLTNMDEIAEFFSNPDNILVMHNGIGYDSPAVEKVLKIKVKAEIVDTLYLSWYLYPRRNLHGLEGWGEELGVPKPPVDDWENLEIEDYLHRCEEDVKIQVLLWKQMWRHLLLLYGTPDGCWKLIRHLNFKARCAAKQEKARWKLDVEATLEAVDMFQEKFDIARDALELRMPPVPIMKKKSRPKKCFKANGQISALGIKWQFFCDEHGIAFDSSEEHSYQCGEKEPNAGSSAQIKAWLYTLGWVPESFKYVRNKETNEQRKIPQIKNQESEELCDSIVRLIEAEPALEFLREMSVVKHRLGVVKGFMNNVDDDGYVYAAVQGLTNTLRFKHKICVNLPSVRKPYGGLIRGLLIARSDNTELCGSDMSSLEDRTKQHYMWKHDPDYVKDMMTEGFDPHLDMALAAGLMTYEDSIFYKTFDKDKATDAEYSRYTRLALIRHGGKGTNYAATYGATGPTIARAAGVDEQTGDVLHAAYWSRNWSLTAIAEECIVKNSRGMKWLWNPVAGLWFWLKAEKDRFSTLNQGTGTYAFDRWLHHIMDRRDQLTGQFHDEGVWEIKVGNREAMVKILKDSVAEVNAELKLNRDLDCDVDFGRSYADIH